jgi:hypothetical protein
MIMNGTPTMYEGSTIVEPGTDMPVDQGQPATPPTPGDT